MRVAVAESGKHRLASLRAGIVAAGDTVVAPTDPADCAVASNWGAVLELQELGHQWVAVCECGYLGNRNAWHSLSWRGLNGRGIHGLAPLRPEPHLEPWREREAGYALLLGQVPTDWAVKVALNGSSYARFVSEVTHALEARGYEVRLREHPEVYMRTPHPAAQRPLLEELELARIAVTLNSTAAIEAVCHGVPTVVFDYGCMASPVSSKIDGPFGEPWNRRAWVNRLARMQWSSEELASGLAWSTVRELIK